MGDVIPVGAGWRTGAAGTCEEGGRELDPTGKRLEIKPVLPCPGCGSCYNAALIAANLHTCPECGHHHRMPASARLGTIVDDGSFEEWDAELRPRDRLQFTDTVAYPDR